MKSTEKPVKVDWQEITNNKELFALFIFGLDPNLYPAVFIYKVATKKVILSIF